MGDNKIESLEKEMAGLKETLAVYLGSLIREVVVKFGEEGKEVVREAALKGGLWQGKKFIKDNKIKARGTKAFADFFGGMSDVESFHIKNVEASDKRYVLKTNICPYIKIWREMGLPEDIPDFCIIATYYDLGLAQAFNPKLKIKLPEDMLRGKDFCTYIFEEEE